MTPHTITTKELFSENILHLQAQVSPNTCINVSAVLKPYAKHGFKVLRYATNVSKGSMQAQLKR